MQKLPRKTQQELKAAVYKKADAHGYMHRDRIENGIFMENLLKDPEVGGKLSEFMGKAELKTYIKDAILNRYAKDKTAAELSTDTSTLVEKTYGQNSVQIEGRQSGKDARLSLHRLSNGELVIVSSGTLLKWETALRKALEFIAKAPGLPPSDFKLNVLIVLASCGRTLTQGDKKLLSNALGFIGVKVVIMDTA